MDFEAAEATEDESFLVGSVFLIGRGVLGYFGMDFIHSLHCGRLVGGSLHRRLWIVSVFSGFLGETGF